MLDLYEAYRNLDGRRKGKVALRDLIKTPFIEANADFRALLERQYYGREGGETRQVTLSEALKMTFPLVSKAERRQVMVLIDMYEHHLGRTTRKAAVDLNTQRLTTLKALFQVRRRVDVVKDWASRRLGSCPCLVQENAGDDAMRDAVSLLVRCMTRTVAAPWRWRSWLMG